MSAAKQKKQGSGTPDANAELTYEQALAEVESIIERIERGEVGLERSIDEYERGSVLIRRCREILKRAEQRVEELSGRLDEDAEGGERAG